MDGLLPLQLGSEFAEHTAWLSSNRSQARHLTALQAGARRADFTGLSCRAIATPWWCRENTNFNDIKDSIDKTQFYAITLTKTATVSSNIRHQGEEVQTGETVLTIGKRLNPTWSATQICRRGPRRYFPWPWVSSPRGWVGTNRRALTIWQRFITPIPQRWNPCSMNCPLLKDYGIVADTLEATQKHGTASN